MSNPSRKTYNARPMKMLIDYLPLIAFAGTYYATDIYIATGVLMAALVIVVAGYWLIKRELHKMHAATAALALVFGTLTLVIHDPVFIKVKPTVLYALFAVVLIASGFIGDKPLMQRALESQIKLPARAWQRLNLIWAAFFAFCGALNLYVAYSFSEATWVNFKLFGMLGLTLVFVLIQGVYLARHMEESTTETGQ